jgi:hypothetical protein
MKVILTPFYVILFLYLFRLFFSSFPFGKLVRDVGCGMAFESIVDAWCLFSYVCSSFQCVHGFLYWQSMSIDLDHLTSHQKLTGIMKDLIAFCICRPCVLSSSDANATVRRHMTSTCGNTIASFQSSSATMLVKAMCVGTRVLTAVGQAIKNIATTFLGRCTLLSSLWSLTLWGLTLWGLTLLLLSLWRLCVTGHLLLLLLLHINGVGPHCTVEHFLTFGTQSSLFARTGPGRPSSPTLGRCFDNLTATNVVVTAICQVGQRDDGTVTSIAERGRTSRFVHPRVRVGVVVKSNGFRLRR